MKNKWIIVSVLIVALVVLCGASLFAVWQGLRWADIGGISIGNQENNVKAEEVEEKTLSVDGPVNLTLNNDFGDVQVKHGADGQVYIKAEKTAWGTNETEAQQVLANLVVSIEQNGDSVEITSRHPDTAEFLDLRRAATSVRFTITVPAETSVTLDTANGDLELSGTTGDADLRSDFGNITIADVSGVVTVKTNNGIVSVQNIASEGDVSLTSEFGDITTREISGVNVSANSTNGRLELQGITAGGALDAGSDFGAITISGSQAAAIQVNSVNGIISLKNITADGKVGVQNDFGDVTLVAVEAGSYDLNTKNGKIKVDQAQGAITAQSNFGDVEVVNVTNGTINLVSTNGAVIFSGSLAGGPHTISNDFGNITLTLPVETALNVDLRTGFGKILSDFEITVSGALDDNHWVGTFNGGGEELTVKTNNGNITIHSR